MFVCEDLSLPWPFCGPMLQAHADFVLSFPRAGSNSVHGSKPTEASCSFGVASGSVGKSLPVVKRSLWQNIHVCEPLSKVLKASPPSCRGGHTLADPALQLPSYGEQDGMGKGQNFSVKYFLLGNRCHLWDENNALHSFIRTATYFCFVKSVLIFVLFWLLNPGLWSRIHN